MVCWGAQLLEQGSRQDGTCSRQLLSSLPTCAVWGLEGAALLQHLQQDGASLLRLLLLLLLAVRLSLLLLLCLLLLLLLAVFLTLPLLPLLLLRFRL